MDNLPLQPLKWTQKNLNPLAELELTAYSALHEYEITEPKQGKFEIKKTRLGEPDKKSEIMTGFTSAKNAQDEAWAHYQRSMQPYVKPAPTWIDASEQLPQVDVDTQFICAYDSAIEPYVKVTYFDKSLNEFDHEHEGVLAWMPIPEFSTMKNLHKGGVIVNGFKLCTNCGKKCFMDSDEYYPMDGKGVCHECQLNKRGR